jgi:hypothetical protein
MSGNYPHAGEDNLRRIVRAVRDLFEGRSNAMGSFTCEENADSTSVTHPNVGPESRILITPTTANAAAEYGAGTIYVSAKALGSFTVTHANSAVASRTFDFAIAG